MAEAKPDAEGFAEDAPRIPTPSAVNLTSNKYDGETSPNVGDTADIAWSAENDFPRQTGSDSLTDEEAQLG